MAAHARTVEALTLALDIGRLVVDKVYDGDASRIGSVTEPTRFAGICGRHRAPSPQVLNRAARLWALAVVLDDPAAVRRLGLASLRTVVDLPTPTAHSLLIKARDRRWNLKRLKKAAEARLARVAG
ncbi:MAG: hypothetical protein CSA66_00870 [Proteobacteria bacterium]|nr:MAG: hypothetical protein CSA66_00870 [Pseudomonadota bacterium]